MGRMSRDQICLGMESKNKAGHQGTGFLNIFQRHHLRAGMHIATRDIEETCRNPGAYQTYSIVIRPSTSGLEIKLVRHASRIGCLSEKLEDARIDKSPSGDGWSPV